MRTSTTFILIAVLFSAASAFALDIPEEYTDHISKIDFFPNGAKFQFYTDLSDSDGNFTAVLPGAFDTSSFRLQHPEDAKGDIMITRYPRTSWTPSHLSQLKSEYEAQFLKVSELEARKSSLEQTLKLLNNSIPDKANPPAIITYIRDAEDMRRDTEKELAALNVTIEQERGKLDILDTELKAKSPRNNDSYITVTGQAKRPVIIEAFTTAASWRPKYTMNLDTASNRIEVKMYVMASQNTGLNYDGAMTLHTKKPDEAITLPEFEPIKVAIKPKTTVKFQRLYKSSVADDEDVAIEDTAIEEIEEIAEEESTTSVRETLSDRELDIKGIITGDGTEREYNVIMKDLYLSCKPVIMLIPELRNDAWIIASMDEGNEHLIPGETELMVDNTPNGKMYLAEYGIGQKIIPFGYAPQITAKKERLIDKTGVSWFSGVFTSGYKLEVTNGMKEEKTVIVRDRLPVPIDDNIKLDVKRIEPKQTERDSENKLTWELTIPAGETIQIIVDYALSYPSGEELQYK